MPSASEIARSLQERPARICGRGTRSWGEPVDAEPVSTLGLDRIVAHEPGDFTAVVQAGVALSEAQGTFAEAGQMLAIDPPGDGTIGGLFATADAGPLRHRYGAARDLIIGVELALPDGTLARGGGRVIKNVAGYDLPKLATGSFGTLGVITEVAVRLHPRPSEWATAVVRCGAAEAVQAEVRRLVRLPLEAEALDVRWDGTEGDVLVRFAGSAAADRAARVADEVIEDDEALWEEQRARQRGELVVRVHHQPTDLARVLRAAPEAVGRAGVGTTWVRGADPAQLSGALAPLTCVVLDAPPALRAYDPFSLDARPEQALMQQVKQRFDPDNHCNPGLLI
ncbi:MAG: glycolate oxidase binding subunit [Solirubrobacteraceae bacterium]|nr:glycolate oxidase binding subunit [Solirubrobacteraceae bacterium]